MATVVLAMSGGVDSSVAADLLLEEGHEVIGVFMRHGEESASACEIENAPSPLLPVIQGRADHKQGCCSASDAIDARRVADRLGIPFYALNLQKEFRRIVDYFVEDYLNGRTPNPCVMCNQWIKFGRLFEFANSLDADFVATGHYARIAKDSNGSAMLLRGLDGRKDQSYALFGVEQKYLQRMLLPVGDFEKSEIRERAGKVGLAVATKKDSQEICFVTSGHHSDFVRQRRGSDAPSTAGEFVTTDGRVVGYHNGYEAFTVGQRKGLGIALGTPHFVVEIDSTTNRVVLGSHDELLRDGLSCDRANWLVCPTELPEQCLVQIRYNSPPQPARLRLNPESTDRFDVYFDAPQAGVAPGQAAVIYTQERVLGGGWITNSHSSHHSA